MTLSLSAALIATGLHVLWLHAQYDVPLRDAFAADAFLFLLYLFAVAALHG